MAISCSNCGKELPDDAKFCGECGTQVATISQPLQILPRYCGNCDTEMLADAKFCLRCGSPASNRYEASEDPQRDDNIRQELLNTSWKQEAYAKGKQWRELMEKEKKENPFHPLPHRTFSPIKDFEEYKAELTVRATNWGKYILGEWQRGKKVKQLYNRFAYHGLLREIDSAWLNESSECPTIKPNHHKALFYETIIEHITAWAKIYGVLDHTTEKPTPFFEEFLKHDDWTDQEIRNWRLEFPSISEIRSWEHKDDELFPPPQPVTYEAAGGIVSFTTDEAVVIVYLDCIYKGKEVELGRQKATVIERTHGNVPICVAIFKPIPFVTDEMKNKEKVINQIKVEVNASWSASDEISSEEAQKLRDEDKIMWFSIREEIILFKGDVKQVDWRGKRGKVERMYDR